MPVRRTLLPWIILALVGGCGSRAPDTPDTIPVETFVSVFVELRASVLAGERDEVDPEERDSILLRHGVTVEELQFFVEVHGEDVAFMREIWDEVENRLVAWGQAPPLGS